MRFTRSASRPSRRKKYKQKSEYACLRVLHGKSRISVIKLTGFAAARGALDDASAYRIATGNFQHGQAGFERFEGPLSALLVDVQLAKNKLIIVFGNDITAVPNHRIGFTNNDATVFELGFHVIAQNLQRKGFAFGASGMLLIKAHFVFAQVKFVHYIRNN